ncbi:MAG: hypothetical protein KQH63_12110 [Desulfobulbaceae bacterium]|nr:hypothetical protein [Desulfobulbaceae bacterium]
MKKIAAFLFTGSFLLVVFFGIANGHSDWAKYQVIPVPDDVVVPEKFILPDTGTLDCCACHWNTNHPGPGTGFCK